MARILRFADLRRAALKLLDAAEDRFGAELDLDSLPVIVAEYWSLASDDAYSMVDNPRIMAGSVTDDLEETLRLFHRDPNEVYLWHDLDHLSGLLRALAFMDRPGVMP